MNPDLSSDLKSSLPGTHRTKASGTMIRERPVLTYRWPQSRSVFFVALAMLAGCGAQGTGGCQPNPSTSSVTVNAGPDGSTATLLLPDGAKLLVEIPPGAASGNVVVTLSIVDLPSAIPTDRLTSLPNRVFSLDISGSELLQPVVVTVPWAQFGADGAFLCIVSFDSVSGQWRIPSQQVADSADALKVNVPQTMTLIMVTASDSVSSGGKPRQASKVSVTGKSGSTSLPRPDPDPSMFLFGENGDTFQITNFTDAQHQGGHCWGFSHFASWYFENHRNSQRLFAAYRDHQDTQREIVNSVFSLQVTAQEAKINRAIAVFNALLSVPGLAQLQDANTIAQIIAWTNLTSRPPVLNMFSYDWFGAAFTDAIQNSVYYHSVLAYSCSNGVIQIYDNNYSDARQITYGLAGIADYGSYSYFFVEPPDYDSALSAIYDQNPPPVSSPMTCINPAGQNCAVDYEANKNLALLQHGAGPCENTGTEPGPSVEFYAVTLPAIVTPGQAVTFSIDWNRCSDCNPGGVIYSTIIGDWAPTSPLAVHGPYGTSCSQTATDSVQFFAPNQPGTYRIRWIMCFAFNAVRDFCGEGSGGNVNNPDTCPYVEAVFKVCSQ